MIEIKGTYTNAIVYTDVVEDTALEQIKTLCDQSFEKIVKSESCQMYMQVLAVSLVLLPI